MHCKFCDMSLNEEDRKMPTYQHDDSERCWLEFGSEYDTERDIVVEYDSGYAYTRIENINYCPMCGRKLK